MLTIFILTQCYDDKDDEFINKILLRNQCKKNQMLFVDELTSLLYDDVTDPVTVSALRQT